jgi:integrase
MDTQVEQNPSDCGSRTGKAKSGKGRLVARIARLVRQAGLGYDDWRYVSRRVRWKCELHPAAKPKRLPRVLTADQFRAFYRAVDEADDVQHALMLRLLFYTGVRVSELCGIEVADVDLESCKVFVNQGKGPSLTDRLPPIIQDWVFLTRGIQPHISL